MKQQDKISFTDVGQTTIIDALRAGLQEGADAKIITPEYEITSPMISDMAKESLALYKGTRTLPPVKFTAPLDGAIQHVSIEGTITL
jgi:hypothetical protein